MCLNNAMFYRTSTNLETKPHLSIYIPTYNRFNNLIKLLDCISEQICSDDKLIEMVEVVISDNSSFVGIDKFKNLLRTYDGIRLSIYINEVNVGADSNIISCFNNTTGKYVWILCDDDLIYPCAIKDVLELSVSREVSLFRLGETIENPDASLIKDLDLDFETADFEIDANWVLKDHLVRLLRASCLVLKRPCSDNMTKPLENYQLGRNLSPLVLALNNLIEYGSGLGVRGAKVRYIEGNKSDWSYLWLWIHSVNIPLVIREFARLHGLEEHDINRLLNPFLEERCSSAAQMSICPRSWPKYRSDWNFIIASYFTRPLFWFHFFKSCILIPRQIASNIFRNYSGRSRGD